MVDTMQNGASQFSDIASGYAKSQGGWGNVAQDAVHGAVDVAANTMLGAKDWGQAYRSAKSGNWGDALKSAAWGAAALGATAAMVVPGAGEAVKGAELAAQAGRAGGEALAKDAAETGVKGAVKAEEGAATAEKDAAKAEEENASKSKKDEEEGKSKNRRLHHFTSGSMSIPGQNVNITRVN